MKILAIFHNYNWEKPNLLPSLAKIGYVEWYDYAEKYPENILTSRLDFFKRKRRKKISISLERRYLKRVQNKEFDFIFWYISGKSLDKYTAKKFYDTGVPSVNISLDDMEGKFYNYYDGEQWTGVADICPYFTVNWTIEESVVEEYKKKNANVVVMPMGVNPEYYKPLDLNKEFDVVFVGTKNEVRKGIVDFLRKNGINVKVFGRGWGTKILGEKEIVEVYNKSKIVLGMAAFAGKADRLAMKGRDFEVLATKSFYITQYHRQISRLFREGEEIECYRNNDELLKKVTFYLKNEQERKRIAENGYLNVIKNHTWEKRFRDLFHILDLEIK